jgi:pimeloyl-ACP methyl ester carboxylesterase
LCRWISRSPSASWELATRFRVYALDYRGHGHSDARIRVVKDAGHFLALDAPGAFMQAVGDLDARLST